MPIPSDYETLFALSFGKLATRGAVVEHQPGAFARSYSAFISYSHRDHKAASRLAERIEGYRLPRQIAHRLGFARLKPVFRDREELPASADLDAAVRAAILQSDFLIVVCTRHTPHSRWVGQEIALFRAAHGDERILAALFDDIHAGCFHAELLHRADGSAVEPIAADFKHDGDGPRLALIKLVARLAGVGLDDLIHRDAQRRTRRLMLSASFGFAVVMAIASAAILTFRAQAIAANEQLRSGQVIEDQLTKVNDANKARGALVVGAEINKSLGKYLDDAGNLTLKQQIQRASLFCENADNKERRGDYAGAAAEAAKAYAATSALIRDHPDDGDVILAHGVSAYWVGYAAWRNGDVVTADKKFREYADRAEQLVRKDGHNRDWLFERGYAASNLGMLALREKHDWTLASRYLEDAQRAFETIRRQHPDDDKALYEYADGLGWLADVDRLRGALDQAEKRRRAQQVLLAQLLSRDAHNALYRADLLGNQTGLARVDIARGKMKAAHDRLVAASAIAQDLIERDPDNASVRRQKRAIELFTVQNWLDNPRRARAEAPRMAALLDCAPDWKAAKGEELATFCSLLSAKWALRGGRRDAAWRIVSDAPVARALRSGTLSPRWQLDFAAEGRKLEAALGRPIGDGGNRT